MEKHKQRIKKKETIKQSQNSLETQSTEETVLLYEILEVLKDIKEQMKNDVFYTTQL